MRTNAPIDFIQPSGGDVLEVHHAEFEPIDPTPTLPSGSVWLEPNDELLRANETRVERLRYQTSSGIQEAKIDEGYCQYTNTLGLIPTITSTPSLYATNVSGFVDRKFYDEVEKDKEEFVVKTSGLYRVTYSFETVNISAGGNNDGVNQWRCLRNNVEIPQSITHYYQYGSNSVAHALKSFLVILDVDDVLSVEFDIVAGGGNGYEVTAFNNAFVMLEFIKRNTGQ